MVTLNDLIAEIVGDIQDEYDDEDNSDFTVINDTEVMIKGIMPVSDFNRIFNLSIETETADTVAGYIIEQLGYIPQESPHELVSTDRFSLTVVEATGTRVETVLMKLKKEDNGEAIGDEAR